MSSKVSLSMMCSAPPLIVVSSRLACCSLRASFAASCDENETVVCIFRDIALRLIGPIDSMICRPWLGMRLRKKVSMSPGCVSGGKPVTRKVCCFESMVWFAMLRMRECANSIDYINAGGASLYYMALPLAEGSRLLDSGVDADSPEDLSAQCTRLEALMNELS